jgi:hypothetical protein
MPLTLNQALFLVLTVAAVVAVVFLVLFLIQLRKTAREGEKTLAELREVAEGLKAIEVKVNARIDDAAEIFASTKTTLSGLSEASLFLTSKIVRPASKYWPIVFPVARWVWQQAKKRKEKRNV